MTDPRPTLVTQTKGVSHRAFRELNTRRRRAVAYLRLLSGKMPLVERVVRQGPVYALGLERKALLPAPALDIDALLNWKIQQGARRQALRHSFGAVQDVQVNLSLGIFTQAALGPHLACIDLGTIDRFEPGQIYILNSNDINKIGRKRYAELYVASPDAFVAVWDFDNHHALTTSFLLASFSDLYVPCHNQNLGAIAQFTDGLAAPVPAGVIQWSRAFLQAHQDLIFHENRNHSPLGRHLVYPRFRWRNATLEKLKGAFPDVGPVGTTYHARTDRDRLEEWCAHMSHWILPTFNDLPIRVFDALVTGGIPIVPRTLRHMQALDAIRDSVFFFGAEDLERPERITDAANAFFQEQGQAGIAARHRQALHSEHVDARVQTILAAIKDELAAQ